MPKVQFLVVGGGPAGSTASSFLARAGFDVTLVEKATFPRYHIGESLLPSCLEILDLIGARELIEEAGFVRKPGAVLDWKNEKWNLDFGELRGHFHYSFQVQRDRFDHLLLQHAASQGVVVREGVTLLSLDFEGERPKRARLGTERGVETIEFDYLVDASGRHGVIANQIQKSRVFHEVFKNVALWGYWENATDIGGRRAGSIAVGSIPHGWLWAIPLSGGQTSIGVVLHRDAFVRMRGAQSIETLYANAINSSEFISNMIKSGKLISKLRMEQDYSYTCPHFAGPGYVIAGDAACFLDPLLSTGVHLAMYSAMLASASLASIARGEFKEKEALQFYDSSYRQAYLRFLVFVQAFYETRGKDGYFTEAGRLSKYGIGGENLQNAFVNLVSGLEDIADAEQITSHLIGEVSKRLEDNLNMRRAQQNGRSVDQISIDNNASFFENIEGITALSSDRTIDGIFVKVNPKLGLSRYSH